jgi:hypothetical protein
MPSRTSLISSAPSGSPWALAVPPRLGEPLPMVVRQMISVGFVAEARAWVMAASTASTSWPSIGPITFQP